MRGDTAGFTINTTLVTYQANATLGVGLFDRFNGHFPHIKLYGDRHCDLRSRGHGRIDWAVLLRGHQ